MNCRCCNNELEVEFINLNFAPPSNSYLIKEDLEKVEKYYPLKTMVCRNCWLVQTIDYAEVDELFSHDYAYFSSTSTGWRLHAKVYCDDIIKKLNLNKNSLVIEVASNDGYLLRNFINHKIPCIGIEPTASTAAISEQLGINTVKKFFNEELAINFVKQNILADLIIGNNVYAHVPNINDFTRGLKKILKAGGTINLEFPHFLQLIMNNQFDTIYHEHFSYLQLSTVCQIFESAKLKIIDVEELNTHGGSLRITGCHIEDKRIVNKNVENIINKEILAGLQNLDIYKSFQHKIESIKYKFIRFLIEQKLSNKKVVGYGAAAKGNTLLNYLGIKADLVSYICDASESKQNKYMPGSHIPIYHPSKIKEDKPNFVVIFPWNLSEEVVKQNIFIRDWDGLFVTVIPEIKIF